MPAHMMIRDSLFSYLHSVTPSLLSHNFQFLVTFLVYIIVTDVPFNYLSLLQRHTMTSNNEGRTEVPFVATQ